MTGPTPATVPRFQKGTTTYLSVGWPLLASLGFLAIGIALGTRSEVSTTTAASATVLMVLATLAGGAGAVALLRTPTAPPTAPFIALAAAVASLLALTPIIGDGHDGSLAVFLLAGPWLYALTPLAVHFALALGWPHRQRRWSGLVVGWYVLHAGLFLAVAGGITAGERPLVDTIDRLARQTALEPLGILTAIGALSLAVASPVRRGAQRRAVAWGLAALALGLGPVLASHVIPGFDITFDGAVTFSRLALALVAFLGLTAVLALPLVNPVARDLQGHLLAQRLLDETDLAEPLRAMATLLRNTFEADGVTIRLTTPRLRVHAGEARGAESGGTVAPEAETIDDHRTLLAPIGRSSDPLGEVQLHSHAAGAFGRHEREWLAAFLMPAAAALRARRREQLQRERSHGTSRDILDAAAELELALGRLPVDPRDDGTGVPPPVDASEVLGRLSEGLEGVSRRSDELEFSAADSRTRIRDASDQVAQALDTLRNFTHDLMRLGGWNDTIATSNQAVSGVAFRTNLLANNASLEATRAGSAGKTFGVLADEIRRLADATAESSNAIESATRSLAEELMSRVAALEALQTMLVAAIREAESGEDAAKRVGETVGAVLSHARSLKPAVEEAYAVARRRTARDEKLTVTTERLLEERSDLARLLDEHRTAVSKVREVLQKMGRPTTRS